MLTQESTVRFDLSTLRENIIFEEKQEAFVKATISSTQSFISDFDAKIRDAENALAELYKQRDAALESMAIPSALMAPVRRLPPEVLGEIFQQCVPIIPTHVTPFDNRDAPLLLTRVCHRWRQVAQGTPLLWTRFVLFNRSPESIFSSMWLKNSGSAPLDISVKSSRRRTYSSHLKRNGDRIKPEYPGHGWKIDRYRVWLWSERSDQNSEMIVEQLSRIRRLSLSCAADELRSYFPKEDMSTLPALQELCIFTYQRSQDSFDKILTPWLQTLVLKGGAELLLPTLECTPKLRNLEIQGSCTLDMFVDFVSRCPALLRIEATNLTVTLPRESMDMRPIVLPHLSHLALGVYPSFGHLHGGVELDNEDWNRGTKSLGGLRTPNLQSLEIRFLPDAWGILSNLLADSHLGFHALTIQDSLLVPIPFGDATSIFASIEKMELIRCRATVPGFWKSLIRAEDTLSNVWTLPKLKTLVLEAAHIALEDEAEFLQFVEHQASPMRSLGEPSLEKIKITHCGFSMETLNALERLTECREGSSIMMEDCRGAQSYPDLVV